MKLNKTFFFLLFFSYFLLNAFPETGHQLFSAGYIEYSRQNYTKAVEFYLDAYRLFREEENYIHILYTCTALGDIYFKLEEYDSSIYYYNVCIKNLQNVEESLRPAFSRAFYSALQQNYLAVSKKFVIRGRYDEAISYFDKLEAYYTETAFKPGLALIYNLKSVIYFEWADYPRSVRYAKKSIQAARQIGNNNLKASNLNNIGAVYLALGQLNKALDHYQQAQELFSLNNNHISRATAINNIGCIYFYRGNKEKAIEYYTKALNIGRTSGNSRIIADSLGYLGFIYTELGRNDAVQFLFEALKINRLLERKSAIAHNLQQIGLHYYRQSDLDKAKEYLKESVTLKEELRKTASGGARKDFLANQIDTYQYLISTYVKKKDVINALKVKELITSTYLKEQLDLENIPDSFFSIKKIQEQIDEKTIIIDYANLNFHQIVIFTITKNKTSAYQIPVTPRLEVLFKELGHKIDHYGSGDPHYRQDDIESLYKSYYFTGIDKIISYYRDLLTDPDIMTRGLPGADNTGGKSKKVDGVDIFSPKESSDYYFEVTSKLLYKLLLSGIEKELEGKKNIIIIPDGLLAYLPFETLLDQHNRYFVEKYNISYSNSLQIAGYPAGRNERVYPKEILALGGAVYNRDDYNSDMEGAWENIIDEAKRGTWDGEIYKMLGQGSWSNLPGTLSEIESIRKIMPAGDYLSGKKAAESTIKKLAENKKLNQYRIIHFSTHGVIFPEVPELSALVLSQPGENGEDGYLTMKEIAAMEIPGDFVNLSACETGLGKLYRGEGVVGLIHGFLLAGTRNISVSLWQVADESTARFMVEFYRGLKKTDYDYRGALSEIKRQFINNEEYQEFRSPYFWAPFVVYTN